LIDFGDDQADDHAGVHDSGPVDVALSQSSTPESLTSRRTTSPPARRHHLADSRTSSMGIPPPASSEEVLLDLEGLAGRATSLVRDDVTPQLPRSASASTTTLRDSRPGT